MSAKAGAVNMDKAQVPVLEAAILAGGLGTRLRGVLDDRPKVLAPIAGRAFLDHLLEALASAGIARVVLCLGYMADKVIQHLQQNPPPLPVEWVEEPVPMGTGGALRFARDSLHAGTVLVINGDTWLGFDLQDFAAAFVASGAEGALVYAEVPDCGRYGRLELDSSGRIKAFHEKDAGFHGAGAINGGVYLLSAPLLDRLAAGDARSLERDFLEKLPSGNLLAYRAAGLFIDIGTPESLAQAATVVGKAAFGREA
jgi:NDP-sugar pyrophosphorylase family protein